nr:uncharacterized protein LOC127339415 [Lolium perenne]
MAEELHRRPPPSLHNLRLSRNNTKEEGAVAVAVAVVVATTAAPASSVRAPVPGTIGPRPPTHQAFMAAPPQAPAGLPYAPAGLPYGGMMPPAPTAHWDPALYTALQHAPSPGAYSGGGDWFMDTGASAHMAAHPGRPYPDGFAPL